MSRRELEILDPGALGTIQDLGRPGYAALGVPRSGALDAPALALANRLVGNDPGAAALELTLTGCAVRCTAPAFAAVTGAPAAVDLLRAAVPPDRGAVPPSGSAAIPEGAGLPDGDDPSGSARLPGGPGRRPVPFGAAFFVPAGAVLRVGAAVRGVRSYLAVSGGIAVEPVLGSRSTDTLSGLGPPPLRAGDRLPLGPPAGPPAPVHSTPAGGGADRVELRIRFGPRDDWFPPGARETLLRKDFTVSPTSNRVGLRLTGPALERERVGELPSEGVVLGAVQVPADGQPLVFLADHPTTGGYPVIAVVHPDDVAPLAQARPGTTVRFRGSQR